MSTLVSTTYGLVWAAGVGSDASNPVAFGYGPEVRDHQLEHSYIHAATGGGTYRPFDRVALNLLVTPDGSVVSAAAIESAEQTIATTRRLSEEELRDILDRAERAALTRKYKSFERDGIAVFAKVIDYVEVVPPERRPDVRIPFPEVKNLKSLRITMETNTHSVAIRGDGRVIYEGGYYTAVEGRRETRISEDAIRELIEAFRSAEYFWTFDDYDAQGYHLRTVKTSIAFDGVRKSVHSVFGLSVGIPTKVANLERAIDSAASTRKWTHITPETIPALVAEGYFKRPERNTSVLASMITVGASPQVVRELIELGAPLNSKTPTYGRTSGGITPRTPLVAAANRGDPEITQMLLSAGAGRNDRAQMSMALFVAAEKGSADVIKLFLKQGANPNYTTRGQGGRTPLMWAASYGLPEAVSALISAGANVNARDSGGDTALLDAARAASDRDPKRAIDYERTVRALLEASADPNVCGDRSGPLDNSPPLKASRSELVKKALLDHGADPNKSCS